MAGPDAAATAASQSSIRLYLTAVVAWAVPGAGHLLLGKRLRGLAFFVLVLGSLVIGCLLDGHLYTSLGESPLANLATLACYGMGLPYFILRFGLEYSGDITSLGWEYGKAFILTAGLMNVLLILDAWDIARGVKE